GRPLRIAIEAGAIEFDIATGAMSLLGRDAQRVLARFVSEPGNRLPIRRPDGKAIVRRGRLAEIAIIALLHRHGDDLAAVIDGGAGAARGEGATADVFRPCDEPG